MMRRKKITSSKIFKPQKTYETEDAWVTPLGEYSIIHYDCPTDKEICQRVKRAIKEILKEATEETDCPLCAMMKGQAYNIVYYCTKFCHECKKAKRCKNFNPNSRQEEEAMNQYIKRLSAVDDEEIKYSKAIEKAELEIKEVVKDFEQSKS